MTDATTGRAHTQEMKTVKALEGDLARARQGGSIDDVFLTLEEAYITHMHSESSDVRSRCEFILRAGGSMQA